ncbi:MAG: hypothetical protein ACLP07_06505 [Terracidiphilus sp.]
MGPMIQALRVENLETRIGLQQFVCATLELELEIAQTAEEKRILALRRTQALKEWNVSQFALELLKRGAE